MTSPDMIQEDLPVWQIIFDFECSRLLSCTESGKILAHHYDYNDFFGETTKRSYLSQQQQSIHTEHHTKDMILTEAFIPINDFCLFGEEKLRYLSFVSDHGLICFMKFPKNLLESQ